MANVESEKEINDWIEAATAELWSNEEGHGNMDEDRLRAIVVAAVGSAFAALERQLEHKLDELAIDVEALAQRFDRFEVELRADTREVKAHLAKLSREDIRDRRRIDRMEQRLAALEVKQEGRNT